jgi:hypothetical protein
VHVIITDKITESQKFGISDRKKNASQESLEATLDIDKYLGIDELKKSMIKIRLTFISELIHRFSYVKKSIQVKIEIRVQIKIKVQFIQNEITLNRKTFVLISWPSASWTMMIVSLQPDHDTITMKLMTAR